MKAASSEADALAKFTTAQTLSEMSRQRRNRTVVERKHERWGRR